MGIRRGWSRVMHARPIQARPITASGIAARGVGAGQLSPMAAAILPLFQTGVQGTWFDPSDFSTMFQDAAGTQPVTALGQPVGKILDRSPRGNHATCPGATTSRPTIEARVNRLTKSESFTESPWSPTRTTVTSVAGIFIDGSGAHRIAETATTGLHYIGASSLTVAAGVDTEIFVDAKAGERTKIGIYRVANSGGAMFDLATGRVARIEGTTVNATSGTDAATATDASITPLGDGWYRCKVRRKSASVQNGEHYIAVDTSYQSAHAGDITKGIFIKRAQLAFYDDPYRNTYQQVNTATDYTDVGSPRYLAFDGTDDWLETSAINMTGTDSVTVVAGARKNTDAARGMICELSATIAANPGGFLLDSAADGAQGAGPFWKAMSVGNGVADTSTASVSSNAAPHTAVLTLAADISDDRTALRVNGVAASAGTGDQGAGNYGNYKLYIGRRGGTTNPLNGRLYGLVIVGASQSDAVITTLEKHMAMKTGVTF